ncbi:MAG: hypothetical protein P4M14_08045 [Gammaproteobacteria bacterium]|nr:hypothetical protein [Gammaproteobacteria bacterium]
MSRPRDISIASNPKGKALFMAINANDFSKFKELLQDPQIDLTITDNCDAELETLLGGDWSIGEGMYGRHENNTLLNFALSMERVDFAEELIRIHKFTGKDIGLSQANDAGFTPLAMTMMINGEYLLHYNKKHQLANLKVYTDSEKKAVASKSRRILAYLSRNTATDANTFAAILSRAYRMMLMPILQMDLLNYAKPFAENNPFLKNVMLLSVMLSLEYAGMKNFIAEEITGLRDELKQIEALDINAQPVEIRDHIKSTIPTYKEQIKEKEALLPTVRDYLDKTTELVLLLQGDAAFKALLAEAMTKPRLSREFFSLIYGPVKSQLARGVVADIFDKGDASPNIFHLTEIFLNNPDDPEKQKAFKLLTLLIDPPMLNLKNTKGETLRSKLPANLAAAIMNPANREEKIAPLHYQPPEEMTFGKVGELFFRGQHRSPIKGAYAAAPVSLALGSNILHMGNNEFGRMIQDERAAHELLSRSVLDGVDINSLIATGTKDLMTPKPLIEILPKVKALQKNLSNVRDITPVDEGTISLNADVGGLPNLTAYRNQALAKHEDKPWLSLDDLFFVITAEGATLSFFSRQNNFYLIDTSQSLATSVLQVFDSWDALAQAIQDTWKKSLTADVTIISTAQRMNNQLPAEPVENNSLKEQYQKLSRNTDKLIANARTSIDNYIGVSEKAGFFSQLASRTGRKRAKAYQDYLTQAKTPLERYTILYALLTNKASTDLRTAVANSLDFFSMDPAADMLNAANFFKSMIQAELRYDRHFNYNQSDEEKFTLFTNEIITKLNANAENGKLANDIDFEPIKRWLDPNEPLPEMKHDDGRPATP